MKKILFLSLILIIFSVLILSSCGTKYICADGQEVERAELCPYNKIATIRERDAETAADNYIKGYLKNKDLYYTKITTYLEKGDYYTKFIISAKEDETNYESLIKVDGIQGTPECVENCQFMNSTLIEDTTQIVNPASIFCEERQGILRIENTPNGEVGICTLSTGEECEEWAYYRGECP